MLIDTCRNQIVMHKNFKDKYWVYAVYNTFNELVFIHYGTLKDVISIRPLSLCDKYKEDECYTFVLLRCYSKKIEAENAVSYWINNSELNGKMPPFNGSLKLYNNDAFIQCAENGRFYRTATDVVKIFGVSGSALSNHLRGVSGYKSVKGLHFKYYYGERPVEIEEFGGYKMQRGEFGGYKRVLSDDPLNNLNPAERDKALNDLRMKAGMWIW